MESPKIALTAGCGKGCILLQARMEARESNPFCDAEAAESFVDV
jgi:hypothetical protein